MEIILKVYLYQISIFQYFKIHERSRLKLNNHMNKLKIIIPTLLLLTFLFSWYELRPLYIRKVCFDGYYGSIKTGKAISREEMQSILDNRPNGVNGKDVIDRWVSEGYVVEGVNDPSVLNANYTGCIRYYGLSE
jgi:hypothetical protein